MYKTHVRPSADLRSNYNEISKIANDRNQVIITKNGDIDVVVIGRDEYEEYEKFIHERYILAKLEEASKEIDDPNAKLYTHDEVWTALEKKWGKI